MNNDSISSHAVGPGDTLSLVAENTAKRVRIITGDGTAIEATLGPGDRIKIVPGETGQADVVLSDLDRPIGDLRAVDE